MKNNNFKFIFVGIVAICLLQTKTILAQAATPAGIPIPSTGKLYTIGQLQNLINTRNSAGTSNFLVAMNGSSVVMDHQCWVTKGHTITNMTGSASIASAGLTSLIQSNLKTSVVLKTDPTLITSLIANGVLNSKTHARYSQILLYFTLNGYRFYLNDPSPGKIVNEALNSRNPAQQIIAAWDFNKDF